jgi:hypothetical protein
MKKFAFGIIFILLFFMCCFADEKALSLCEKGVDSLLRSSQMKFYRHDETFNGGMLYGYGYVDGHCLGSEKALLLHNDRIQIFEFGNFKKGYYEVDSVVLPFYDFKAFKNRQQVPAEKLYRKEDEPYCLRYDAGCAILSIYPYKNKVYGVMKYGVITIDFQEKDFDLVVYIKLYVPRKLRNNKTFVYTIPLDLISVRNDTIVVSEKEPFDSNIIDSTGEINVALIGPPKKKIIDSTGEISFVLIDSLLKKKPHSGDTLGHHDTVLVTLDGENIVPKIRNNSCLKVTSYRYDKNGFTSEKRYYQDEKKCFSELWK